MYRRVPGASYRCKPFPPGCDHKFARRDERCAAERFVLHRLQRSFVLGFIAVLALTCRAAVTGPLTTLAAIAALDNARASQSIPVDFEATVVFSRGYENVLFVQDGKDAIFVRPPSHVSYEQGDRLRIHGRTQNSFRPIVVGDSIAVAAHGNRPKPVEASFSDLIRADLDCHLVKARGRVRSADLNGTEGGVVRNARLQLVTDGGHLEVDINSADKPALESMLDADVEVTGAAAGKFDDKMQQTGVVVYVAHLDDVRVLRRAGQALTALPVTPMDRILEGHRVTDTSRRVRVHGTITYYEPGVAVVLQDGPRSLWIETHTRDNLTIGNQADASGYPAEHDRILTLADGEIEDLHIPGVVKPLNATWEQLAFWSTNSPVGHENDLVSIEGRLVTAVREPSQDEYVLDAGGSLFSAIARHPGRDANTPLAHFPVGARVRVTGICTIPDLSAITPGGYVPFQILVRSPGDLVMIANPPLLSVRNLSFVAGVLLLAAVLAMIWGWTQERKVHRQAGAMAQLEQRRSAILESINHSRPLAEVLEQITEMVSSSLNGAACWIEVADGAKLGRRAESPAGIIVTQELSGQAGTTLGKIYAASERPAVRLGTKPHALEMGARLAVLAIETHRLYSDLTYRSEFDALTDAHNRFSLDRQLDSQVDKARANASVFALIYIDLDGFKQINDLYGHHVGDLYLQEAAARMQRQLRPGDILARLGGDEFAILVPDVHSRPIVEEIGRRLSNCFVSPVLIDGHSLPGSASIGIALYPDDGATSDELLKAADAAMYEKKKNAIRMPN
jgi:diguanylate cyclase (GGDEF)-like protein